MPDLADAFELADVEAVEANEFTGPRGVRVPLRRAKPAARLLREQAAAAGAVVLEDAEPLAPGSQP